MNKIFSDVLIIDPSSTRKGGIASVLRMYKNNINTNYFESTKFQSTFLSFLFFPFRIFSLMIVFLTQKNIGLVHIHRSSQGSFYRKYDIFKVSKWFKKKIIFHLHSDRLDSFCRKSNTHIKKRIEKLISQTDAAIVLSKTWKAYLQKEFYPKARTTQSTTIPYSYYMGFGYFSLLLPFSIGYMSKKHYFKFKNSSSLLHSILYIAFFFNLLWRVRAGNFPINPKLVYFVYDIHF